MSSNQHLQRLVDSMGGGNNNNNNNECPQQQQIVQQITSSPSTGTAIKKRKLDQVISVQTISDSSDEGLGSMSPEPVTQMLFSNNGSTATTNSSTITKTHLVSATSVTTINVKDYMNLQNQMETERRHRMQLEEQLKQLEMQVYSGQQQKYHLSPQPTVVVPQQDMEQEVEEKIILHSASGQEQVHYVPVSHHSQFVVVSTSTPGSSPKHVTIVNDDDDNSRTLSSDELHKEDDVKLVLRATKASPKHHHQMRIPSILEQAIKAEPKVEVERINSPCIMPIVEESIAVVSPSIAQRITASPPAPSASVTIRTTYPNNSHQRPNLETIVEAIRHLEGDAFDMDEETATSTKCQQIAQDVPLALTTSNKYQPTHQQQQQQQTSNGHVKEPFKFRQSATSQAGLPTFVSVPLQQQQQYQQRPGVIVVKQSS
jgi:transcription factor AP-4